MPHTFVIDGRFAPARYPGIHRYTTNLARALAAIAPDDAFALLELAGREAMVAGFERLTVTTAIRDPRAQWTVPRRLAAAGAELFHAPYFVTAYRPPCPLVVSVHDTIGAASPPLLPSPLARLWFRLGVGLACRSARLVLTLSEASRRDLRRSFGLADEKIVVTPLAAAPGLRRAAPSQIEALRARLDLRRPYVLFVGAHKPHKNLTRLVAAWGELRRQGKTLDHELVLAGYRDRRYPEAEKLAARLELADVRFPGAVPEDDLAALYSGAELFVLPSLCEGFGLPLVEAMACGTPVAAARTSSLPEVAGDAAAWFDPTDVDAIASVVARLLDDAGERRSRARQSLERASMFSWERTARTTLDAYRSVLAWPQNPRWG